jgi:hypothetical protein
VNKVFGWGLDNKGLIPGRVITSRTSLGFMQPQNDATVTREDGEVLARQDAATVDSQYGEVSMGTIFVPVSFKCL